MVSNIKNISTLQELRGLDLNSYTYKDLNDLLCLRKLEYLRMEGKCESNIPFSSLSLLQCVYLNYNKKNCASIFECKQLENIFIDNYSETSSKAFSTFKNAKRIGLIKSKITEFEAIHNLGLMVKCTPEKGQKNSLFHLMVKCTPIIVELPSVYRGCKPLICFQ